ncbi:MAG: hypothetical protein NVS3B20_10940 [Polyangiales bacterium]
MPIGPSLDQSGALLAGVPGGFGRAFSTNVEIRELEGQDRWSVTLLGRAQPRRDMKSPQWGVESNVEITRYRGNPDATAEPVGLGYPDLQFEGEWKQFRMLTQDARIVWRTSAGKFTNRIPQANCNLFENFAARQKTVLVTWSGGAARVCAWSSFFYEPTRGPDRKWAMSFKVLSRGVAKIPSLPSSLTGKSALAALKKTGFGIDDALASLPPGMAGGFLDSIKSNFGNLRQSGANLRKAIGQVGDLAKAPADILKQVNYLAQDVRATLRAATDTYEQTGWEYQVAVADSKSLLRARTWKSAVTTSVDSQMDVIIELLALLDRLDSRPRKYIACVAGQSLVRIALREYGPGAAEAWRRIADANGLTGQTVPVGVSKLVIPEL